jgi:hypothetical protein
MKLSRLLAYAAGGVIVGLLFENKALILKSDIEDTASNVKRKAGRSWRRTKKQLHLSKQ